MLRLVVILAFVLAQTSTAKGTITGQVTLRWPKDASPKEKTIFGKQSAIIYVTGFVQPPENKTLQVKQKKIKFMPNVLPVTKGQRVTFINNDRVAHNVFSNSPSTSFDLGLVDAPETRTVTFSNVGLVNVYCNIHPEMALYVLVLPNRAHAQPNKQGKFKITGVPEGKYTVYAWHPLAKPVRKQILVKGLTNTNWEIPISKRIVTHLNKKGRPYKNKRKKY